jgi:riboflavin synthase
MFTGIIEATGKIISLQKDRSNLIIEISSPFISEIKVDQSIAHNGVCLTVEKISGTSALRQAHAPKLNNQSTYFVSAIDETLQKTNLGDLKEGDEVNLERCMQMGGRLDGHIVQGHVDGVANCVEIIDNNGSKEFVFEYASNENVTVSKGSITVNGISLTVVQSEKNKFSVAIIPYTLEHTNFKNLKVGHKVNIEFDIIGKYVQRMMTAHLK